MSRIASFAEWMLRLPIVWGGLASLAFYAAISQKIVEHPLILRYFTGHVILTTTTVMFFIGVAALVMRWLTVGSQMVTVDRAVLSPVPDGGQPLSDIDPLLEELDELPPYMQQTYLVGRIRGALQHLRRKSSLEDLEPHLRHLEETDLATMSSAYGMARTIIWAIPILGFLGTVIGITLSIAKLSPDQLESSLGEVTNGLGVAFDTTALALGLSMGLMFLKFFVEGVEERLLMKVDARTSESLVGRFYATDPQADENVTTVRRMSEQVIEAVELMVARQAQVWQSTVNESQQQWAKIANDTGQMLESTFTKTINTGLVEHANTLRLNTDQYSQSLSATIREVVASLSDGASQMLEHTANRSEEMVTSAGENSREILAAARETSQQIANAISEEGQAQFEQLIEILGRLDVSTERHGESLTTSSREFRESLAALTEHHTELICEADKQHTVQVNHGATELSNRLRAGLERMAELLVEALQSHGEALSQSESELAQENRRHLSEVEAALGEAMVLSADRQEALIGRSEQLLEKMQQSLLDATDANVEQQKELHRQGEILLQAVEATGQVKALEDSLNANLDALSRSQQFEDIMINLSATLQLLSTRVGDLPSPSSAKNRHFKADAA